MKPMLLRVLAVVVVLTPAIVFTQGAKTKPTTATLDIPEHVDYLSFRPSPGILTAGWVHPVLRSRQ